MKKVIALAAVGLFALSGAAWACGGMKTAHSHGEQTKQPTITLAPASTQTASSESKKTEPGS